MAKKTSKPKLTEPSLPAEREIGPIIELNEDILKDNVELATRNNRFLKSHNIKSFDIVGAIGAGKTTLLEKIAEKLTGKKRVFIICGDTATTIDADRIRRHGAKTIQINTGRACALNAYDIQLALKDRIPNINEIELLLIENVGNLICPSDFVLGADKRIMVVSVAEGERVIAKHPLLVKDSQVIIINKVDIAQILEINIDQMVKDALDINPKIIILKISAKTGEGMDALVSFLMQ